MQDKPMWWAHLHICREIHQRGAKMQCEPPISETTTISTPPTKAELDKAIRHNLTVNQKAVLQPLFWFRRWLEDEKQAIPDNQSESITDIESRLPPLRGQGSGIINYVKELERVEDRLLDFYNGNNN
ncbi:hypothetical protein EDD21DRAFT_351669 [Dissophora ornata]|nr:hypothetical protein BGZ58_006461 [Dissophora ornata]KAI8603645.1 hypothetical protein EDD21DRAFT_351669 [Dissophora ornata]